MCEGTELGVFNMPNVVTFLLVLLITPDSRSKFFTKSFGASSSAFCLSSCYFLNLESVHGSSSWGVRGEKAIGGC